MTGDEVAKISLNLNLNKKNKYPQLPHPLFIYL